MSELKLLNCPFCGGKPKIATCDWGYSVKEYWCYCSSCGCETQKYHSKEDAIAQWNERKPMANIVEKLEYEKERHEKDRKYWSEKSWKDSCIYNECDMSDRKCECFEEAINIVKQEINKEN